VNVERLSCPECRSRFYFDEKDEEQEVNGTIYCSYCAPMIICCGVCGLFRRMAKNERWDGLVCEVCRGRIRGFPTSYQIKRFLALARDRFTCRYCGVSPLTSLDVALEVDHIIPKSKGGKDTLENFITACHECNAGKLAQLLEEDNREAIRKRVYYKSVAQLLEEYGGYQVEHSQTPESNVADGEYVGQGGVRGDEGTP
jgi:5-methylcytosine-specific restriction endonuclease McrA